MGKYERVATWSAPALVIYLIDVSASMDDLCGENMLTKLDLVNKALRASIKRMFFYSMQNGVPDKRYRVAMFAYSAAAMDLLGGIYAVPDLMRRSRLPELSLSRETTDTAAGFAAVEELLRKELRDHRDSYKNSPAPLVCHLTDAWHTTEDPSQVVRRIQAISVEDGAVLVENVLLSVDMLRYRVEDWHQWEGVSKSSHLSDDYARLLCELSSPLPEVYRQQINKAGYRLRKDVKFFFPGTWPELVQLAVVPSITLPLPV